MLQAVVNAFKIADLRRKILFTLAMLVVFRLVAHVPVPGVDLSQLQRALEDNTYGGLFNILNIFSGGTLQNFSVAAMGVYPYITATIIIQLLTGVIPRLTELSKEGEAGRNQMNKYMLWLTVPLAAPKEIAKYDSKGNVIDKKGGEYIRKRADGGIDTATQALEIGLIDGIGPIDDAIAEVAKQASLGDWRAVTASWPASRTRSPRCSRAAPAPASSVSACSWRSGWSPWSVSC